MKTAQDIMEPIGETLKPEDSLEVAVRRMRTARRKPLDVYGVKGMLVMDETGTMVGMVSVKDILKTIVPTYMDYAGVPLSWPGMLEETARKVRHRTVAEFMTRKLVSVSPKTTLMECAELIVKKDLWRLPVVDDKGTPVGMVYARDLQYAIAEALFGEVEGEGE